jgi:hypothetical protein
MRSTHGWLVAGVLSLAGGGCSPALTPIDAVTGVWVTTRGGCAIAADGVAWCWGRNSNQEIDASKQTRTHAVPLAFPAPVTQLAQGAEATCAVLVDGAVQCFGPDLRSAEPRPIDGLAAAAGLLVGWQKICGVGRDASLSCWTKGAARARPMFSWPAVKHAAGPVGERVCGVMVGGTVECFRLDFLLSGIGDDERPRPVAGLAGVESIARSGGYFCATHGDGAVDCWEGDAPDTRTRVLPPGDRLEFSGTPDYYCTRDADGEVACWDGIYQETRPVTGLSGVTSFAVGPSFGCAATADRRALCWGFSDEGNLGNGVERELNRDPWVATPVLRAK